MSFESQPETHNSQPKTPPAVGWVERMGQSRVWVKGELRLKDVVLAECRSLIVLPGPEFLDRWGEEESYWRVYSDEQLEQA